MLFDVCMIFSNVGFKKYQKSSKVSKENALSMNVFLD